MNSDAKKALGALVCVSWLAMSAAPVSSHCEIPCGIYDDQMRVRMIAENITTIEKSMKQVQQLSKQPGQNMNQLVRWVQNKEKHADDVVHVVTQYFMTQRVKPVHETESKEYKRYVRQLTLLHEMLVYAMKSKQTTDTANTAKLKDLVHEFAHVYGLDH